MVKIFIVLILFSCTTSIKTTGNEADNKNYMELDFLSNYKSSVDSIGDKVVTKYNKLNLVKETRGKEWLINLGDKKVVSGDYGKHSCMMEIYKGAYLLLSYVHGINSSTGPDAFPRDSVIVIELASGALNKINLPKTCLTRSRAFLFNYYQCPEDTLKFRNEYSRYSAIDSIDILNNQLFLINQCRWQEKFNMIRQ